MGRKGIVSFWIMRVWQELKYREGSGLWFKIGVHR